MKSPIYYYMKIKIESYKKSGPSQCYVFQCFRRSSSNCGNSPRCLKCTGIHNASNCNKLPHQEPTCCNWGKKHTENFRGCPFYQQLLTTVSQNKNDRNNPVKLSDNRLSAPSFPKLTQTQLTRRSLNTNCIRTAEEFSGTI